MKKIAKHILQAIGVAFIVYYFGFFISMEESPKNWLLIGRIVASIAYAFLMIMIYLTEEN